MAESVARRELAMPAAAAFDRLTATQNHSRLVPLTAVRAPRRRPRVGDLTVATSAGFFVDRMELVELHPPAGRAPGRARWVKRGPVLLGEAEIVVTPLPEGRCAVAWFERDIRLAGLPARISAGALTAATGLMTRYALARLDRLSVPRHGGVRAAAPAARRADDVVP